MRIPFFSKKERLTPDDIAAAIRAAQEVIDDLERQRPSFLTARLEAEETGNAQGIDEADQALSRLTNKAAAVRHRIEGLQRELREALQSKQAQELSALEKNLQALEAERQDRLTEAVQRLAQAVYAIQKYTGPDERLAIWANLPTQEMRGKLSETTLARYPWREIFGESWKNHAQAHPEASTFWQRRGALMNLEAKIFNPLLQNQWVENEAIRLIGG